jgi:transcriptional regulator with XRE-family HTH domain
VDSQDPRQLLAQRLRALREERWPGRKITQSQLAHALGGSKPLSVPLISSWESQTNPRIPPLARLEGYAALFATARSFEGDEPRLLSPRDMSDEEQQVMTELKQELTHLRNDALRSVAPATGTGQASEIEESLSVGPWRFEDGNRVTIVCAQWPQHMLDRMPYTDVDDPDYIELLTYSELDALFELHGHLRAANPANQVNLRIAGKLTSDDYTSHLISLGGVDWNTATSTALQRLPLPVQQIADWSSPGGQFFEVEENGKTVRHRPVLEKVSTRAKPHVAESPGARGEVGADSAADDKEILREDVALFARAVSPFNRKRTVTICNGMYGRGTYGVVRALTDAAFRDRNADYLRSRFSGNEAYCILTRVPVVEGATLTPDWTSGDYSLFEWPG